MGSKAQACWVINTVVWWAYVCALLGEAVSLQGVVKYHGPRPSPGANKVYVANHTSMIDFIVLQQMCGHAVIMQKHGGWVGWLQDTVLESIGCVHRPWKGEG